MRRWFQNRLAMLLAAIYVAAMARAMAVLPHDELDLTGVVRGSAPVWRRASPFSNTKRELAERTIDAAPPEQSKGNNT
jgi:hypothetical protein